MLALYPLHQYRQHFGKILVSLRVCCDRCCRLCCRWSIRRWCLIRRVASSSGVVGVICHAGLPVLPFRLRSCSVNLHEALDHRSSCNSPVLSRRFACIKPSTPGSSPGRYYRLSFNRAGAAGCVRAISSATSIAPAAALHQLVALNDFAQLLPLVRQNRWRLL